MESNPNKLNRWRYPARSNIDPDIEPDFAIDHFVTRYGEFTVLELRYRNEFTVEESRCMTAEISWIGMVRSFEEALAFCSWAFASLAFGVPGSPRLSPSLQLNSELAL